MYVCIFFVPLSLASARTAATQLLALDTTKLGKLGVLRHVGMPAQRSMLDHAFRQDTLSQRAFA